MAVCPKLIACCLVAGALAVVPACTTRPVVGLGVGVEAPQRIEIARGDTLRVLTRDGRRRTIRIENADTTTLYTSKETILVSDLVFVERQQFSGDDVAAAASAAVLIVLMAPLVEAIGAAAIWAAAVPN